jgi:uncharacterized protein with FMN-binding domain
MRRAVLTLGGTVAGLAALLSFKTHSLAAPAPAPSAPPPASAAAPQAMTNGTGSSGAASAGQTSGATPRGSAIPTASTSAQPATRTVTGRVDSTMYGPMQVQVTLAGTKITKVAVLQRTDDGAESDQIDASAIPQLTSETLTAQSAHIDAVSGASYTSSGYIQSLQSALDQAGA